MEVFIADADGKNVKQVTDMPGANWHRSLHRMEKRSSLLPTMNMNEFSV
jgi:hypothetical protein